KPARRLRLRFNNRQWVCVEAADHCCSGPPAIGNRTDLKATSEVAMTRIVVLFLACLFAVSVVGCTAYEEREKKAIDSFLQGTITMTLTGSGAFRQRKARSGAMRLSCSTTAASDNPE